MFRRLMLHLAQRKEKALILAAEEGRTDLVRTLLEAGVNPDSASEGGFTALMWAAARGHVEVVQVLLRSGAAMEAQTRKGRTARDIAVQEGRDEIAGLLRATSPPMTPS